MDQVEGKVLKEEKLNQLLKVEQTDCDYEVMNKSSWSQGLGSQYQFLDFN